PRALFAALGVIEAELKFGSVPCTSIFQHRRLPFEVVRVGWRGLKFILQPPHLHNIVTHGETIQPRSAAAHVRQRANTLLRICLLERGRIEYLRSLSAGYCIHRAPGARRS